MPGSKIAKPALPLAFAMYIATSALRTMSEATSEASRALAMPMLAVTETCWSPMRYGARSSRTSRSAIATERFRSGASSVRTANSSPPSRATRSPSRTEPRDPLGDRDEQGVAGGVAERVVDDLEVVEVEEEDGA